MFVISPITIRSFRCLTDLKTFSMRRCFIVIMAGCMLVGCAHTPTAESFFQVTPESAKLCAMQTRMFETSSESELLSASASVLQDLGFQLDETSKDMSMLRAAKERGAREYGQEIARVLIFILGALGQKAILMPVDLHQQINAVLVARPSPANSSLYSVRVVFYRSVWQGDGNTGDQPIPPGAQMMEIIDNPMIYQQFFAKLAKSLFLEVQEI